MVCRSHIFLFLCLLIAANISEIFRPNKEFMKKNSPIKTRILQYIKYKGISKYKFYKNTDITRGILNQENGISEDNITKFLAQYNDICLEWLFTGSGEMLKEKKDNTESHSLFDLIQTKDKEIRLLNRIIEDKNTIIKSKDEIILNLKDKIRYLEDKNK